MKSSATQPEFSPVTLTIQLETAQDLEVMYNHTKGLSAHIRENSEFYVCEPGTEEFGEMAYQISKTLEQFVNTKKGT